MKLWLNFEESVIKERKDGWKEGDDFEGQLVFEEEQDLNECRFEFKNDQVFLHLNNGVIIMSIKEFGSLFK